MSLDFNLSHFLIFYVHACISSQLKQNLLAMKENISFLKSSLELSLSSKFAPSSLGKNTGGVTIVGGDFDLIV